MISNPRISRKKIVDQLSRMLYKGKNRLETISLELIDEQGNNYRPKVLALCSGGKSIVTQPYATKITVVLKNKYTYKNDKRTTTKNS